MVVDSLDDLHAAFRGWRSKKKYPREAAPEALVERARRAAAAHGMDAVVRVTKFRCSRLLGDEVGKRPKKTVAQLAQLPAFSRVEVALPTIVNRPLAEAETPTGMKLRLFQVTPETVSLLAAMCGIGGAK